MESLLDERGSGASDRNERAWRLRVFTCAKPVGLILACAVLLVILVLVAVSVSNELSLHRSGTGVTERLLNTFALASGGLSPRRPRSFDTSQAVSRVIVFGDHCAAGYGASSQTTAWTTQTLQALWKLGKAEKAATIVVYAHAHATSAELAEQYQEFADDEAALAEKEHAGATLFVVQAGIYDADMSPVASAQQVNLFARKVARDNPARRVLVLDYASKCQGQPSCQARLQDAVYDACTRADALSAELLSFSDGTDFAIVSLNAVLSRHGLYRQRVLALTDASVRPADVMGRTTTGTLSDPFTEGNCTMLSDAGQSVQAQALAAVITGQNYYPIY